MDLVDELADYSCFVGGKIYLGNTIGGSSGSATYTHIASPAECQRKCQEWPKDECAFFSWSSGHFKQKKVTMCWLKSQRSDGQLSTSKGIISGPKRCIPKNSGTILFVIMG